MNDFLSGAAVAFVGAILGWALGWWQKKQEDSRKRCALASALLVEMCFLENSLREVYESKRPGDMGVNPFRMEIFASAGSDLLLFAPNTVQVLNHFYRLIKDVHLTFEEVIAGRIDINNTPHLHWWLQSKAIFPLQILSEAKCLLESTGGRMVSPLPTCKVTYPELPLLPPRAFESFDPEERKP